MTLAFLETGVRQSAAHSVRLLRIECLHGYIFHNGSRGYDRNTSHLSSTS